MVRAVGLERLARKAESNAIVVRDRPDREPPFCHDAPRIDIVFEVILLRGHTVRRNSVFNNMRDVSSEMATV